jgi:hypothetical protein
MLAGKRGALRRYSGDVAARPVEAGHNTFLDRIASEAENDRSFRPPSRRQIECFRSCNPSVRAAR